MADCNCDDSIALRAELETVRAERDYLVGMASPDDLRIMRQELAAAFERTHCGALPEAEQSNFEEVIG
jgi:hypothetical protein